MTPDPVVLTAEWRSRADALRRFGSDERAAQIWEMAAAELEQTVHDAAEGVLTLTDAARESGYSEAHLGRLIQRGVIVNAGRKGAPSIRPGDLPKKAKSGQKKGAKTEEQGIIDGLFRDIVESKYGGN